MFKDYVVQLLRGVQNVTYIQHNYLHTVIAVDNTQTMGNVLDVFKQRTGNSFLIHDSQLKRLGYHTIISEKRTFLFPAFPGQLAVYWEYKLPSDNTALLAVVPKKDKPHIVLPGLHILDCNYGPEQNKWNKRKAAEGGEKKQNVDHSQASVSKVDCPARICIKETFLLEGYQHVNI